MLKSTIAALMHGFSSGPKKTYSTGHRSGNRAAPAHIQEQIKAAAVAKRERRALRA